MLDPALILQIHDAWHAWQRMPGKKLAHRELPDLPSLKRSIEACFYASLQDEEGRSVRFSCTLASKVDVAHAATMPDQGNTIWPSDVHTFESAIPLTAINLAKLAPSIDPRFGSFAVAPDDSGKEQIWGTFTFEPSHTYFQSINAGGGNTFFRPDFLTVTPTGKGSLLFSRRDFPIGRLAAGQFSSAMTYPFTSPGLLNWWRPLEERAGVALALAVLKELLGEISRRSHGATLVILDSTADVPNDLLSIKYAVRGNFYLLKELDMLGRSQDLATTTVFRRNAGNRIKRLAQLSAVDGALITTPRFEPIGYGATLKAAPWNGRCLIFPTPGVPDAGEEFQLSRYGTRHTSALNFAGACPGSIVFVISQDGPIRAFTWASEKHVYCWPDCDLRL